MEKVVIASMRKGAGKTSTIVGIAGALNRKMAYVKPFGDRMLYRKKRLWDYDSALISSLFGL
jgi:BioD-like phosphotransacetylase family protein